MASCARISSHVGRAVARRQVSNLATRSSVSLVAPLKPATLQASAIPAQSTAAGRTVTSPFESFQKRFIHISRVALAGHSGGPKVNPDGTTPFLLTDVGEGIAQCEILKWYIKVGDRVEEFDKIVEVQSDKANVVIPSRYTGVVTKLYVPEGEMVKVGSPLVDIRVEGSAEGEAEAAAPAPTAEPTPAPATGSGDSVTDYHTIQTSRGPVKVGATPAVRRIARELGINLSEVTGTGKDGRITKEDLQRFSSEKDKPRAAQKAEPAKCATAAAAAAPSAPAARPQALQFVGGVRTEPIRGLRRAMVKSMTATTSIPHFGYCDEIAMDALAQLRDELRSVGEKRGVKITFMPFIIKATSLALKSYPVLNASVSEDASEIIYKESHNIGVAMDTPQGLIVPNIKNCQLLSVFEIAEELNRLQKLGSEGKLSTNDLTGGTFSLSNIGAIGGTYASPVLMLPEVMIGALGKVQVLPRFAKGSHSQVVPVRLMQVSWSADHRVIDGATAANFSNLWKRYLENPATMVLDLK